jgi:hypothetical protein
MKRKTSPPAKSPAKPSATKPAGATPASRVKTAASPKPEVKKLKAAPSPDAVSTQGTTKQSQVIALLRTTAGASIADLVALTGWQTHTVRGMLSGSLRKRLGLDVQCQRVDGIHVYRIVEAATA